MLNRLTDPCDLIPADSAHELARRMYQLGHADGWGAGHDDGVRLGMQLGEESDRRAAWWDGFATASIFAAALFVLEFIIWWATS